MKISFEMACEIGLIRDDALDVARRVVEGASILSPATDRAIERSFRARRAQIYRTNGVDADGILDIPEAEIRRALHSSARP